jgi:two-component system cell cycle sensor histidine kinase/response regulator CckA
VWPTVRVLYMSGYHDDDVMLRSLATAKVDFLQKPFLPYDLAEKVRTVLERA